MTTKNYADYIDKQTRALYNIMLEPILGELTIHLDAKKIGVLYQNQCYLWLTDKGKELLPNAKDSF